MDSWEEIISKKARPTLEDAAKWYKANSTNGKNVQELFEVHEKMLREWLSKHGVSSAWEY
jgi:hypothetical protein